MTTSEEPPAPEAGVPSGVLRSCSVVMLMLNEATSIAGREPWGGIISTFQDPDGNYLQLIEYRP